MTPQGCIDDLMVRNIEEVQRDPSLGHVRKEPALFDENVPFLLEPPTTRESTRTVTENTPTVTVGFRFTIAPAPLPDGLAAASASLLLPDVAAAPALVVADRFHVEEAEPQAPEQPHLPTQDVRFTDGGHLHTE